LAVRAWTVTPELNVAVSGRSTILPVPWTVIVRAGGEAGLFSAILAGWTGGRFRDQSQPVTKEIPS
jgi:hypothetical protein